MSIDEEIIELERRINAYRDEKISGKSIIDKYSDNNDIEHPIITYHTKNEYMLTAWDGDMLIGHFNFFYDDEVVIAFYMFVLSKYRCNGISKRLYDRFLQIYNDKFYGYDVEIEFINPIAERTWNKKFKHVFIKKDDNLYGLRA